MSGRSVNRLHIVVVFDCERVYGGIDTKRLRYCDAILVSASSRCLKLGLLIAVSLDILFDNFFVEVIISRIIIIPIIDALNVDLEAFLLILLVVRGHVESFILLAIVVLQVLLGIVKLVRRISYDVLIHVEVIKAVITIFFGLFLAKTIAEPATECRCRAAK